MSYLKIFLVIYAGIIGLNTGTAQDFSNTDDLSKDVVKTDEILRQFESDFLDSLLISKGPKAAIDHKIEKPGYNLNEIYVDQFGLAKIDVVHSHIYGREIIREKSATLLLYDPENDEYGSWTSVNSVYCFKYKEDRNSLLQELTNKAKIDLRLKYSGQVDSDGNDNINFILNDHSKFRISSSSEENEYYITIYWAMNVTTNQVLKGLEQSSNNNSSINDLYVDNEYEIMYPSNWYLDDSGLSGTSFVIFSPASSPEDEFSENVNLISQPREQSESFDQYIEKAESQIENHSLEGSSFYSERLHNEEREYHKMIYSMYSGDILCKYIQYTMASNGRIYVLTLTVQEDELDMYQESGLAILNSFKLKDI